MNVSNESKDIFTQHISLAAASIRDYQFKRAYEQIIEAMCIDPNAPQPHNLLGIWFELNGNKEKARRHYRAAYSLDPSFKPACKNLEQICTVFGNMKPYSYDFGDEPEEEYLDLKSEKKTV